MYQSNLTHHGFTPRRFKHMHIWDRNLVGVNAGVPGSWWVFMIWMMLWFMVERAVTWRAPGLDFYWGDCSGAVSGHCLYSGEGSLEFLSSLSRNHLREPGVAGIGGQLTVIAIWNCGLIIILNEHVSINRNIINIFIWFYINIKTYKIGRMSIQNTQTH